MRVTRPFDLEQSDRIGKAVHARSRYCWANAMRGLFYASNRDAGPLVYVEGFVVLEYGIIADHGWLQHDGGIVDPTPNYRKAARAAARSLKPPRDYFAAKTYDLAAFSAEILKVRCQPFTWKIDPESWIGAAILAQVWKYGRDTTWSLHNKSDEIRALIDRAEEGPHARQWQEYWR